MDSVECVGTETVSEGPFPACALVHGGDIGWGWNGLHLGKDDVLQSFCEYSYCYRISVFHRIKTSWIKCSLSFSGKQG